MSHGLFITGAALLALAGPADAQDSFGAPATAPAPPAAPPGVRPPTAADSSAETRDDGVPPPRGLHSGAMHGPTPAAIPGGRLITTPALVALLRQGGSGGAAPLVLDVLGGPEALPGAQYAVPAHQSGSFDDRTQQEFGQYLQRATQGRRDTPLVFYCASTQCWMSYNAALRAIALGYRQVLWYRGGLQAWKQAGQPVQQR